MSRHRWRRALPFILVFTVILSLLIHRHIVASRGLAPIIRPHIPWDNIFSFAKNDTRDCAKLFRGPGAPRYDLSEEFQEQSVLFYQKLADVRKALNFPGIEGNSGDLAKQSMVYQHLAKQDFVSNICEIGFNAGHSTLQWLTAKPTNRVYSFDIGKQVYAKQMASHFNTTYPRRFSIEWGDSKTTVPKFIIQNKDLRCDILVIDGGHDSTKQDIENLRWLANPHHHLIILNDHPSTVLMSVGQAWLAEMALGGVKDIFQCSFLPGGYRGFTIGQLSTSPTLEMKRSICLLWTVAIVICFILYLASDTDDDTDNDDSVEKLQSKAHMLIEQNVGQQESDKIEEIYHPYVRKKLPTAPPLDVNPLFWFVPVKVKDCRDLFRYVEDSDKRHTMFPVHYQALKVQYDRYLKGMLNNLKIAGVEGNSGDLQEQSLAYYYLGNSSFVKTICETGFNAGHSTFTWLASNPNVHVYSFDLGEHPYSRPMASFLRDFFKKRLTVYWGDSKLSIPSFTQSNPDVLCDIIVVDGGHTYVAAKEDLQNFRAHAAPDRHLLLIDDHPTKVLGGVRKAWEEEVQQGRIQEHFACTFYPGGWRGFTVAKYNNLPEQ